MYAAARGLGSAPLSPVGFCDYDSYELAASEALYSMYPSCRVADVENPDQATCAAMMTDAQTAWHDYVTNSFPEACLSAPAGATVAVDGAPAPIPVGAPAPADVPQAAIPGSPTYSEQAYVNYWASQGVTNVAPPGYNPLSAAPPPAPTVPVAMPAVSSYIPAAVQSWIPAAALPSVESAAEKVAAAAGNTVSVFGFNVPLWVVAAAAVGGYFVFRGGK